MPDPRRPRDATYRFGPFAVHTATREVRCANEPLLTSPRVFDLLVALLRHRDRVLSHGDLLRLVWPRVVVSRGALPQAMLQLRKLLSCSEGAADWIATVRGVGYRFAAVVDEQVVDMGAPQAASGGSPGRPGSSVQRVDALHVQALTQGIRSDHEGLRLTILRLRDKAECGADPRARVFALLHENVIERHANGSMADAWQGLQSAERMCDQLQVPELTAFLHRGKGLFQFQFVSAGEAIAWFRSATELSEPLGNALVTADNTFLLAVAFGRSGDAEACEEWTERAERLSMHVEPAWFGSYCSTALAGTWVHLGELAAEAGDLTRARQCWSRSIRMLDEVEARGDRVELGPYARVLDSNRAWAEGYLFAHRRPASIELLRRMLAQERMPQVRLSLMLGLSTFLRDEACLAEARQICDEGLALGDATGMVRHRRGFLGLSADISSRQGLHEDAAKQLRALLRWQEDTARADALRIAKVTALRLRTERALASAATEREIVRQLQSDIDLLRREASLRDTEVGSRSETSFRSWLALALTRAHHQRRPLVLGSISVHEDQAAEAGGARSRRHDLPEALSRGLASHARPGDVWWEGHAGRCLIAFVGLDPGGAQVAARRLQGDLEATLRETLGDAVSVRVRVADVSQEADVDAVLLLMEGQAGEQE
jgi:DNA-binding winged helix-turn-helix (wHTH) protein